MGTWLDSDCVYMCLNSYQRRDSSRAVCSPGSRVDTETSRMKVHGKFDALVLTLQTNKHNYRRTDSSDQLFQDVCSLDIDRH